MRVVVAGVLVVLAWAVPAGATCKCGDVGGCKVRTCTGFNPGDSCTPPLAGVCRIVKGNANDAVCCCRCRLPPPPPGSGKTVRNCADHYAWMLDDAKALPDALLSCQDSKVTKQAETASKQAVPKLDQAEQACEAGNGAKETKQAVASTKPLVKAKTKFLKLQSTSLTAGCTSQYANRVADFGVYARWPGAEALGGRAVVLDSATGSTAARSVVCLSRIQGGCVNGPVLPNCACTHLHQSIFIDKAGPFTDPQTETSNHCGHGCVIPAPGCGSDTLPDCL
jgi:hypothetical protein